MIDGILSDLASGGLTTLFSGVVSSVSKYFTVKMEFEHKKAEWEHIYKMHKFQFATDKFLAEQKLLIEQTRAEWGAYASSINAESNLSRIKDMPPWVNAFRGSIRPGLTVWLWVSTLILAIVMSAIAQPYHNPVIGIWMSTALAAAEIATGFWFGSRLTTVR